MGFSLTVTAYKSYSVLVISSWSSAYLQKGLRQQRAYALRGTAGVTGGDRGTGLRQHRAYAHDRANICRGGAGSEDLICTVMDDGRILGD